MRASETRALAHRARGPGVSVPDLCCGVAGPGRMITAESGCADTVWPIELAELTGMPRKAGLTAIWRQVYSSSHHEISTALLRCYRADSLQIAGQIGTRGTAELITAHQLWSHWLGSGRVRKFAMMAEKR